MLYLHILQILCSLLAVHANAQKSPVKLCTAKSCDNCPTGVITRGTGYPNCVIYDRETVLGVHEAEYNDVTIDYRTIWFDIAAWEDTLCQTISQLWFSNLRREGGICLEVETKATFIVQFCCGTGDCSAAGVKRDGMIVGNTLSSMVLRDMDDNLIVPHSVGDGFEDKFDTFLEDHGVNSLTVVRARSSSGVPVYRINPNAREEKRACDTFNQDGGEYTKTGSVSTQVSGTICGDGTMITITNEHSVSHTTTFGASVGDPFGIVSASVEFSTEETASQSKIYSFTPDEGECGHLTSTPFYVCVGGTITGCEGGDQNGEVCTAKRISQNEIGGVYFFVQD